jgi:hypothetical protein
MRISALKFTSRRCRCDHVLRPRSLLRHPGALIITTLAASDLAYRLLLRESLRRALGVDTRVPGALGQASARRSAGARRLRG